MNQEQTTKCTAGIGFCVECTEITHNGKPATSHTVLLPGGSEHEVITDHGRIVHDGRPWQFQPGE